MSAMSAELLKLRSTRTTVWLAGALCGIVTLAAVVHVVGFESTLVDEAGEQRTILTDIGVTMGLVFAAISGALAITSEFRHGTIRSTLLKQPDRRRLLGSKLVTQAVLGAALAALATGLALALTAAFLAARDLTFGLDAAAVARLLAGAGAGGAGFGVAGLALGTAARHQVPVVVGTLVWVLFLESLLRSGAPSVARFAPASLGRAIAADGPGALTSPVLALAVLAVVVAAGFVAARISFVRRDIS